jgi:hypothetical protein
MQKIIRIDEPNETILSDRSAECYVLNSALADDFCKRFIEKASDKADEDIKEKVQEAVKKWDVLEWFEKVAKAEVGEEDLPRWGERIKAAENWAKINGLMDTKVNVSGDLEIEVSVVHAED